MNISVPRQAHHTNPQFKAVSRIPTSGKYKTVLDCRDGYYWISMAEEEKKFTRFITHHGSYEYNSLTQGLCNAGDIYTKRYDDVTQEFTDCSVRLIDDTCLWAGTPEEMFKIICAFLTKTGKAGMLYNKEMFQYCKKGGGLPRIQTEKGVFSGEDIVNSIRDFPRPTDLTSTRAFFGLVEQASYTFSKKEAMATFRHLLKKENKETFEWTPELNNAFMRAKDVILEQIQQGVKRQGGLEGSPAWSQTGAQ